MKMKKINPHKKGSLTGRVLRFLGVSGSVEEPPSYQEITHVPIPTDNYYTDWKGVKAASLEAERRKAEALMDWQKRRFIC